MSDWWEQRGETSEEFNRVRDTVPGGNPRFLTHTDEQLEAWREHLTTQRDSPEPGQQHTIGGPTERASHEQEQENRERLLREIEAEQLHRLMLERDRTRNADRGDDDRGR